MSKLNPIYIGLLFLLIIGFKFTFGIENIIDIYWSDEGLYLYNGRFLFERTSVGYWGPVYSIWYKILSLIQSDPINLYYLNYKLMVVLPGLFIFILFSKLDIGIVKSFLLSLFFIISYNNNIVWPKISSFCIIFIIFNLIFIKYLDSSENKFFVSSIISLICSYIRPEFFLSFVLFTALLLYFQFKNNNRAKLFIEKIGLIVALLLLFIVVFGYPISSERSFMAFGQHFAAANSTNDVDAWLNWEAYADKKFMGARTLPEAFFNNPSEIIYHIISNIKRYPGNIFDMLLEVIIPKILFSLPSFSRLIFIVFITIIIIYYLILKKLFKSSIINIIQKFKENFIFIFIVLIYLVPSTFAILINAPRQHYMILQVPLLTLFISLIYKSKTLKNKITQLFLLLCFTLISLLVLPSSAKYYYQGDYFIKNNVRFIENLKIDKPVTFLNRVSNLTYFLPGNYMGIDIDRLDPDEANNFQQFDIIYLSSRLMRSEYLSSPDWIYFLSNYEQFGYEKLFPKKGYPFLVKKALLLKSYQ